MTHTNSLVLPRWVLYATYLVVILQGIALMSADSLAVPRLGIADYLLAYGSAVALLGAVSLVSSYLHWEEVECAAAFFLFAGLTSLVGFTFFDWLNDTTDRGALSIIAVLVLLFTLGRFVVLFRGITQERAEERAKKRGNR